jgi:MFS family permease
MPPLFLAVFFSIFQGFGGLAFGRGLNTLRSQRANALALIALGTLFGLAPLLFEWFFLLRRGHSLNAVAGPVVFVVAAIIGALVPSETVEQFDNRALAATAFGGAALLLGITAAPYLIGAARANAASPGDVAFGVLWFLLFVGIGGGIAWTGLMALLHGRTFDQEARHRRRAAGRRRTKPGANKEADSPRSPAE